MFSKFKDRQCCLDLAGWQETMMQPLMHIMGSFLSDLIPPLSISSSSFALRSVVPFFFQLPLSIYLLSPSSLHLFSDSASFCYSISIPFAFVRCFQNFILCSSNHPSLHPTTHFPCSWVTDRFIQPQGGHINPMWMGERSKRVDVPRGCKSECIPAVWQCSATWTEACAGTSNLSPGLLI